jgi:hypothetical protein
MIWQHRYLVAHLSRRQCFAFLFECRNRRLLVSDFLLHCGESPAGMFLPQHASHSPNRFQGRRIFVISWGHVLKCRNILRVCSDSEEYGCQMFPSLFSTSFAKRNKYFMKHSRKALHAFCLQVKTLDLIRTFSYVLYDIDVYTWPCCIKWGHINII